MVFYKGSLTYSDLKDMPIPEILNYNDFAEKINQKTEAEIKKAKR